MKTPALLTCFIALSASAAQIHVAPTGNDSASGSASQPLVSLDGARQKVRSLRAQSPQEPVTVSFAQGEYFVPEPVLFTPEDSGSAEAPITYQAGPGARVVLHGSRRITGWQQRGNLWVTRVSAAAEGWRFRQLYINGEPRPRARIPNQGFLKVAGCPEGTPKTVNYHKDCQSFQFASGDIRPDWANLQHVEVIVYHFWTDSHLPIRSVDTKSNIVTFAHKAGKVFTDDFTEDGARYIVENVREGLDQPGEWYLDYTTGELSYFPKPGENIASAVAVAPVTPALIRVQGEPAERRFVEHLNFERLGFSFTHFVLPPGNSNDQQGSASIPAAVTLKGARQLRFEQCSFSRLGTWAVEMLPGCSENVFRGNTVQDVAAGGFRINGGTERNHPLERTRNNRIEDNVLTRYGQDFPSAVGILLMHTSGNTVAHNEISHGGYTGISIGWIWGYQRSVSRDNLIQANHIHHIGGILSDMGGIYTLGPSPGTVLRGNLIHDVDANHYGGWGIYHDEGSTGILVEDNVVYNTKFAGFNIHFAKEIVVRNNIFALAEIEQLSRGKVEPHKSVFFENNILYWRAGDLFKGNWKDTPYTFHFHPKDKAGTRSVTNTFDIDWNVYWNPGKKTEEVKFDGKSFQEWQSRGKDENSIYADPMFVDPDKGDFRLRPNSPALKLGFRPIDLTTVGPRKL